MIVNSGIPSNSRADEPLNAGVQAFVVSVPTRLGITAPAQVNITHDLTDAVQRFPAQQWSVRGNSRGGMVIEFSIAKAFKHHQIESAKNDARLSLSVTSTDGPATWLVTQPSDQTSLSNDDETAVVQATSDDVGSAMLELNVDFVAAPSVSLATGDYTMEVVCTISTP
ncbi:hypothetical protein [Rubripirellula reticaptiva]|uniref:hypothetical protein n=1 Tax=Rubripirellula reticaptiva TaxID=2528013 RepID=UPI0011B61A68|nr:hypothetical protein [Rubripirellula reticaptiva]